MREECDFLESHWSGRRNTDRRSDAGDGEALSNAGGTLCSPGTRRAPCSLSTEESVAGRCPLRPPRSSPREHWCLGRQLLWTEPRAHTDRLPPLPNPWPWLGSGMWSLTLLSLSVLVCQKDKDGGRRLVMASVPLCGEEATSLPSFRRTQLPLCLWAPWVL